MRANRLLSIVLLLQRHRHLTAKTLADEFDVTERTIYRDIEALSMAGIPVYTRTGPDGGCFLDESYRSSLNWFTGAELQTLLYSSSASPLSELGLDQAMDNAVLKLLALLPTRHQQEAERMKQRLYIDPSGWYGTGEDHPALATIKEAVWSDRLIDAHYETWEGEQKQRTLAPYSLVYKLDHWYLAAAKHPEGELRTYRVSRMRDVTIRLEGFERDPLFDIAAYWKQASAQFIQRVPEYPVVMRVRPFLMVYFNHLLPGRFKVIEKGEAWWLLRVNYTVFDEARTSLLGLGTEAEVIEPLELHDAVVEMARGIVAKYSDE